MVMVVSSDWVVLGYPNRLTLDQSRLSSGFLMFRGREKEEDGRLEDDGGMLG